MKKPQLVGNPKYQQFKEIKQALDEAEIDYTEIPNEDDDRPRLFVPENPGSYRRLSQVKGYIRLRKEQRTLQNQSIH